MDYVAFGQVITDDIFFPGKPPILNQLGGVAYATAGMRFWSSSVGVASGVGGDFYRLHGKWFDHNRISTAGAERKAKKGAHSKIIYLAEDDRREVPLPGSGSLDEMMPDIDTVPNHYGNCRGIYFYTGLDKNFWVGMEAYLRIYRPVSVWEMHSACTTPENREHIMNLLHKVSIVSLNLKEGQRLMQEEDPVQIVMALLDGGANTVLLRMGAEGALATDRTGIWHIPAYPAKVVDVTGGGNASTGGFLVGYCESGGDVAFAGKCAAVSASFIIEQFGPPADIISKQNIAKQRLTELGEQQIGNVKKR